jgi:solute carrier family 6 amino acid transporter-like protein 5/7/9/14
VASLVSTDGEKGVDGAGAGGKGRQQWNNQIEFLLSCIAMSVGLGNIWRFPFTAYENGGGAFLIPYLVVLFLIGKPLYFLELAMGQFSSFGSVKVWAVVPGIRGDEFIIILRNNSTFASFLVHFVTCRQQVPRYKTQL